MIVAIWTAAALCAFASLLHIASIAIATLRCRAPKHRLAAAADAAPFSLVRPVCGLDNDIDATLRSGFQLTYPDYELILCLASASDPAVPLIGSLMAEYPSVRARLLVGDERISANPKLNNVFKGWHAAEHDRIVLSDSNVLLPRDYLERVLAAWKPDTGLVSAPPVGGKAAGFWANLECAFLNTYQARWQYAADTIGMGFAQGKTLACRRSLIEAHGGIRALGAEAAEDAAATKLVRAAGRRVRLVDAPFEQPLGRRELAGVWSRQVRWARLRRDSFPAIYALEALAGAAVPGALLAFVVCNTDLPVASIVGLFLGAGEEHQRVAVLLVD